MKVFKSVLMLSVLTVIATKIHASDIETSNPGELFVSEQNHKGKILSMINSNAIDETEIQEKINQLKNIKEQPKQQRDLTKFPLPSMYYYDLYKKSLQVRNKLVKITDDISSKFDDSRVVIPPLKGFERTMEKVTNYHKGDWSAIIDVVRGSISFQNMDDLKKGLIEFYKRIPIVYILDTFDTPYDTGISRYICYI